jgi:pimeloyl-ACP methyl ester carboxylesterase
VSQDDESVRVATEGPAGPREFSARWVIGADGAGSAVRKALGLGFDGTTWPERFVATNVRYPFDEPGPQTGAAMYVEWELPVQRTAPCPIVLVHGGGGQGTDWLGTLDCRPGWAPMLAKRGWPVFVVDRPGHGRSAGPGRQEQGPTPTSQLLAGIFAPGTDPRHTQWPGSGGSDDPLVRQLAAASTGLPQDAVAAQQLDAARLVQLLAEVGPAVVITHSLGAPAGWLAADARPDLVTAVVALEPPGPPFIEVPEAGLTLPWGLTAAPLTYDPPVSTPEALGAEIPRRLPRLAEVPVAVVEAEASALGAGAGPVAQFLLERAVAADHIRLADHDILGNGHGMMFERNSSEVLDVVERWLLRQLPSIQ